MKSLLAIALMISITLVHTSSQTVTLTLPVPQKTITEVTLSIQKLEDLLKNFDTVQQNKWAIYKRVELTKAYLSQLSQALVKYNNVIAGTGNAVVGNKNLVIGNYNNIEGNSNWVFVSQYTGQINGDLLVGQWRIELDKSNLIPINTRFAISFLKEEGNTDFKSKFGSKTIELCKWDKWANPSNTKANAHWSKYNGYNQWKRNVWQKVTGTLGTLTNNLWKMNSWGWRW